MTGPSQWCASYAMWLCTFTYSWATCIATAFKLSIRFKCPGHTLAVCMACLLVSNKGLAGPTKARTHPRTRKGLTSLQCNMNGCGHTKARTRPRPKTSFPKSVCEWFTPLFRDEKMLQPIREYLCLTLRSVHMVLRKHGRYGRNAYPRSGEDQSFVWQVTRVVWRQAEEIWHLEGYRHRNWQAY